MGQQVIWHQRMAPGYDEAELYEQREVCEVIGSQRVVLWCEGESCTANEDGRLLRTAADFRAAFPDGRIPTDGDDGWSHMANGWFMVSDQDGAESEPVFSLAEAYILATQLAGHAAPPQAARPASLRDALGRGRQASG